MKMKKITILLSVLFLVSCMSKEEKMKAAEEEGNELISVKAKLIEGAGDALQNEGKKAIESATKGIGEVIKGANSGITESINVSKVISEPSFQTNFEECKAEKIYGSDADKVKKVNVYLIAKNNFKGKLILKAFDKDKKEIGRSSLEVSIEKEDAKYVDFSFDERTHLLQTEYFTIK
jgi:hypothetical protein